MKRRTIFVLSCGAVVGLALATMPQNSLAQSDPWIGTWQLNLAESKYSPGPPPKSGSVNIQGEGQNRKATVAGINAGGNSFTQVYMFIHDSQQHPVTGAPGCDALAYTPVDDYTINWTCTKGGQVMTTGSDRLSRDGKTFTITIIGFNANGRRISDIAVYDKQ
jgi:hypothetical protein